MSNPIQIEIESDAAALLRGLESLSVRVGQGIARAMDYENELTVGEIQARKLSRRGPTTLGVVTNRLRPSVRPSKAAVSGLVVASSIGSNVRYAGVHEFGFDGMVRVRPHRRRIIAFDRYERVGRGFRQTQVGLPGDIRGHSRQMRMPERAYIRSTISERQAAYGRAVSQAIIEAWGGAA